MRRILPGTVSLSWLVCSLALSAGCSSEAGPGCVQAECVGDPGPGCAWACVDGSCRALCPPECVLAADCGAKPWEEPCQGRWECQAGACRAVCESPQCVQDHDCTGVLPCEHGGRWRCQDNTCRADCDPPPQCQAPVDCLGRTWPESCFGHWSCPGGSCRATCDPQTCPNGSCDTAGGEDEGSCPADCVVRPCTTASDCNELTWPLACLGVWMCEAGACRPECRPDCGQEGWRVESAEACCAGLRALVDCPPELPNCEVTQRLFCVDCGDGACDPHESTMNCLGDCPLGCQVGERRSYLCPQGVSRPWCECRQAPCEPICIGGGTGQEGWRDPCTGNVRPGRCANCTVECRSIGTRNEGWYAICPSGPAEELIDYAFCAPRWDCQLDPPALCD
jgi:hypothetical protein